MQTLDKPFMFSHFVKPPSELPLAGMKNSEICRMYQVQNCHDCDDLNCGDNLIAWGYKAMAEENREIAERFFPLAHDPSPEGLPDAPGSTRGL